MRGHRALTRSTRQAHKLIVEALEAEMAARGFTKVATGGDVTLSYSSMAVTNVD